MEDSPHPVLYHGSPHISSGSDITPFPQETCVYQEYEGMPEQQQHQGAFVFAGKNLTAAHAYALKLEHPVETEHGNGRTRHYQFMAGTYGFRAQPQIPGNNASIVASVITRPQEFLKALEATQPKIFSFRQESDTGSYRFEEVRHKDGTPTGEFICRGKIPVEECKVTLIGGIEQVMDAGVQILFLNESITKNEWFKRNADAAAEIDRSVPDAMKTDPEALQRIRSIGLMTFIDTMIESGVLIHANRQHQINAIDFKTGETIPSPGDHRGIAEIVRATQQIVREMGYNGSTAADCLTPPLSTPLQSKSAPGIRFL